MRLRAIGFPMIPSPMNPTRSAIPLRSLPTCQPSGRARPAGAPRGLLPEPPRLEPAERGLGARAGPVLEAHPAVVAGLVERLQHEWIVDLAGARLVARRAVRDLDVPDPVKLCPDRRRQVPL